MLWSTINTEGQIHIDNNSNINCDLKAIHHLLCINYTLHFLLPVVYHVSKYSQPLFN
jgi:hypothetical protein